jgi:hypothetical protein
VFVFVISDFIVPSTITKANLMWAKSVKREAEVVLSQRNIWVKGYRSIFHIKKFFLHEKIIKGISLYYFDQDFKLIRRVDANEGYYKEGKWIIKDVMEQILDKKGGQYNVLFHEEMVEKFGFLPEDLKEIVQRSCRLLDIPVKEDGAFEIARRSRGTPRVANRLLRRVRDFAQVQADGIITRSLADHALNMLEVDEEGLDKMDRHILITIIEKFDGGPIGLGSLSAAVSEEKDTIEDVYEPFLIQIGFIKRTPQGRVATKRAYRHLGFKVPDDCAPLQKNLFWA